LYLLAAEKLLATSLDCGSRFILQSQVLKIPLLQFDAESLTLSRNLC